MCTTFWSRNSSHLIHGLHILRPKFGVLRGSIASTVEKRCTKMSGGLGLAMLHSVAVPESSLGDTTSQGTACACVHRRGVSSRRFGLRISGGLASSWRF